MDEAALRACQQPDGPLRPTFCNIPLWGQALVYLAGALAVAIFAFGVYRHWRAWRAGRRDVQPRHLGHPWTRARFFLRYVVGQRATWARRLPGVFHSGLFYGFVLLFVGTVLATVDWDVFHLLLQRRILSGWFYLAYEAVLDTFGLLFVLGLLVAIWRRYVVRPHHVLGGWDFVIWSLLVVNVTGFLVEGLRLALHPVPWGRASWVGQLLADAVALAPAGLQSAVPGAHQWLWVIHMLASLLFVAAIPYTNAVHMVNTAANATLRSVESIQVGAALRPIDIDNAESFGVGRLVEFDWKQRLGVDSCLRCGRCELVCPAHMAGTPLNPKAVIVDLSRALRDELDAPPWADPQDAPLVVGADAPVTPPELWACTTCMACVEACPAFIEIVDDIVDMRRYLTLTEGDVPGTGAVALRNMATSGNPWGYAQEDRLGWAEGLDVPIAREGEHVEVLYWVGCSASYDRRNQSIARAVVKLLRAAGVSFAVMREERCNCESARRMGEEYLYQTATAENVASIARYSFDRLVAHCPHCFNTLRNEYPQFGGDYEVVHHSHLLSELIAAGRLSQAGGGEQRVAFHDSCYLGRYNRVFDAPRAVLGAAGVEVVELPRSRENGLCCGGGGGKMWFEDERVVRKVEEIRMAEALEARPDVVGVACPFCLTMLDGAAKSLGAEGVAVMDVSEVLALRLGDGPPTGGPETPGRQPGETTGPDGPGATERPMDRC